MAHVPANVLDFARRGERIPPLFGGTGTSSRRVLPITDKSREAWLEKMRLERNFAYGSQRQTVDHVIFDEGFLAKEIQFPSTLRDGTPFMAGYSYDLGGKRIRNGLDKRRRPRPIVTASPAGSDKWNFSVDWDAGLRKKVREMTASYSDMLSSKLEDSGKTIRLTRGEVNKFSHESIAHSLFPGQGSDKEYSEAFGRIPQSVLRSCPFAIDGNLNKRTPDFIFRIGRTVYVLEIKTYAGDDEQTREAHFDSSLDKIQKSSEIFSAYFNVPIVNVLLMICPDAVYSNLEISFSLRADLCGVYIASKTVEEEMKKLINSDGMLVEVETISEKIEESMRQVHRKAEEYTKILLENMPHKSIAKPDSRVISDHIWRPKIISKKLMASYDKRVEEEFDHMPIIDKHMQDDYCDSKVPELDKVNQMTDWLTISLKDVLKEPMVEKKSHKHTMRDLVVKKERELRDRDCQIKKKPISVFPLVSVQHSNNEKETILEEGELIKKDKKLGSMYNGAIKVILESGAKKLEESGRLDYYEFSEIRNDQNLYCEVSENLSKIEEKLETAKVHSPSLVKSIEEELKEEREVRDVMGKNLERIREKIAPRYTTKTVKVHLSKAQEYDLAYDGVGAKKYKDDPRIKQKKKHSKLPFSYDVDLSDIESFPKEFERLLEPTTDLVHEDFESLFKLMDYSNELARRGYDTNIERMRMFSKTNLGRCLRFCDDLCQELNYDRHKPTKSNEFIVKRMENYPCYIISKPTGPNNHLFFSVIIRKDSVRYILKSGLFQKPVETDHFYAFHFKSVDKFHLSQYMTSFEKIFSLSSMLNKSWRLRGDCLKSKNRREDIDRRLVDAKKTLSLFVLLQYEGKMSTAADISNVRYSYMKVSTGLTNRNGLSVIEKFSCDFRSRLAVFLFRRYLHSFFVMSTSAVKPSTELSGVSSKDRWNGLINWCTGEKLLTFEQALILSYLQCFRIKEGTSRQVAAHQMLDKIIKEEAKLTDARRAFMGYADPDFGDEKSHEMSPTFIKIMTDKFWEKSNVLGMNKESNWLQIKKKLSWKKIEKFATTKKSNTIGIDPKTFIMKTLEEIVLWENNDSEEPNVMCLVQCYKMLRDGVLDQLPFTSLFKMTEYVCKHMMYVSLFLKNQNTGIREIFILFILDRILINFVEMISRHFCSLMNNEMMTKGKQKSKRRAYHMSKLKITSDLRNIHFSSADDATKWCQGFIMPVFSCMLSRLLPKRVMSLVNFCLNRCSTKCIRLPKLLVLSLCKKSSIKFSKELQLLKKDITTDYGPKVISETGFRVMFNRSNMMQGVYHYTSGLLHSIYLNYFKIRSISVVSSYLKIPKSQVALTTLCSSDDSSIFLSVSVPPGTSEEAVTAAAKIVSRLKERGYPRFAAKQGSSKSCELISSGLSEFNSEWQMKNTSMEPFIKFLLAAINSQEYSNLRSAQIQYYNLRQQCLAGSATFDVMNDICISQCMMFYRTLGAFNRYHFRYFARDLLVTPYTENGLFLFDLSTSNSFLGFDSAEYLACKMCHTFFLTHCSYYEMGGEVSANGERMSRIRMFKGKSEKLSKIWEDLGLTKEEMEDYVNANSRYLWNPDSSIESSRVHMFMKLLDPAVAEGMMDSLAASAMARSVYVLDVLSYQKTIKTERFLMDSESIGEELRLLIKSEEESETFKELGELFTKDVEKLLSEKDGMSLSQLSELRMKLKSRHKMFFKTREKVKMLSHKLKKLRSSKMVATSLWYEMSKRRKDARIIDMNELFPKMSLYEEYIEIHDRIMAKCYKKTSVKGAPSKKITIKFPEYSIIEGVNIKKLLKKYYGDGAHLLSNQEARDFEHLNDIMKGKLKSSMEKTFESFNFSSHRSLYNYLQSLSGKRRSITVTGLVAEAPGVSAQENYILCNQNHKEKLVKLNAEQLYKERKKLEDYLKKGFEVKEEEEKKVEAAEKVSEESTEAISREMSIRLVLSVLSSADNRMVNGPELSRTIAMLRPIIPRVDEPSEDMKKIKSAIEKMAKAEFLVKVDAKKRSIVSHRLYQMMLHDMFYTLCKGGIEGLRERYNRISKMKNNPTKNLQMFQYFCELDVLRRSFEEKNLQEHFGERERFDEFVSNICEVEGGHLNVTSHFSIEQKFVHGKWMGRGVYVLCDSGKTFKIRLMNSIISQITCSEVPKSSSSYSILLEKVCAENDWKTMPRRVVVGRSTTLKFSRRGKGRAVFTKTGDVDVLIDQSISNLRFMAKDFEIKMSKRGWPRLIFKSEKQRGDAVYKHNHILIRRSRRQERDMLSMSAQYSSTIDKEIIRIIMRENYSEWLCLFALSSNCLSSFPILVSSFIGDLDSKDCLLMTSRDSKCKKNKQHRNMLKKWVCEMIRLRTNIYYRTRPSTFAERASDRDVNLMEHLEPVMKAFGVSGTDEKKSDEAIESTSEESSEEEPEDWRTSLVEMLEKTRSLMYEAAKEQDFEEYEMHHKEYERLISERDAEAMKMYLPDIEKSVLGFKEKLVVLKENYKSSEIPVTEVYDWDKREMMSYHDDEVRKFFRSAYECKAFFDGELSLEVDSLNKIRDILGIRVASGKTVKEVDFFEELTKELDIGLYEGNSGDEHKSIEKERLSLRMENNKALVVNNDLFKMDNPISTSHTWNILGCLKPDPTKALRVDRLKLIEEFLSYGITRRVITNLWGLRGYMPAEFMKDCIEARDITPNRPLSVEDRMKRSDRIIDIAKTYRLFCYDRIALSNASPLDILAALRLKRGSFDAVLAKDYLENHIIKLMDVVNESLRENNKKLFLETIKRQDERLMPEVLLNSDSGDTKEEKEEREEKSELLVRELRKRDMKSVLMYKMMNKITLHSKTAMSLIKAKESVRIEELRKFLAYAPVLQKSSIREISWMELELLEKYLKKRDSVMPSTLFHGDEEIKDNFAVYEWIFANFDELWFLHCTRHPEDNLNETSSESDFDLGDPDMLMIE